MICGICGAEVGAGRVTGKVFHLEGYDDTIPEHEPVSVDSTTYQAAQAAKSDLAVALAELLAHHNGLCPGSDCPFAQKARLALA